MTMRKRFLVLTFLTVWLLNTLPSLSVVWAACPLAADGTSYNLTCDTALKDPTSAYNALGNLISVLLTLALFAGGITALFFFIFGAIQWITSRAGDGAAKARSTMIYAVVGLIALSLVYVFMAFYNNLIPQNPLSSTPSASCTAGGNGCAGQ
jgi:hypothetical protein